MEIKVLFLSLNMAGNVALNRRSSPPLTASLKIISKGFYFFLTPMNDTIEIVVDDTIIIVGYYCFFYIVGDITVLVSL